MDNQQERLEEQPLVIDLSWLAGVWESDGSFSLRSNNCRMKKKTYIQHAPLLQFVNTDPDIMLAVINILRRIQVGYYELWRLNEFNGGKKLKGELRISGIKRNQRLLTYLIPYLKGTKKKRAEVILEYCNERLSKPKYAKYGEQEFEIINKWQATQNEIKNIFLKSSETNTPNIGKMKIESELY
uniref:Homing endonuclease n=1 Tax=viral metagenome TaxID=1070528 RepID=A0A6H1ZYV8_9ZZZZ